jgi:hypothetical protein
MSGSLHEAHGGFTVSRLRLMTSLTIAAPAAPAMAQDAATANIPLAR